MLSGCAMNMALPDSSPVGVTSEATSPLGSFSGSVYGGHAPIVGAHIFVLQATTGGYGQQAKSLLNVLDTSGVGAGYPVQTESSTAYGTNGMGYVTSDMYGNFNISGEYTCSPGLPVYLYETGGTSEVLPNSPITAGTVTSTGAAGTINFTSNNLLSIGQKVVFAALNTTNENTTPSLRATLVNTTNVYTVTAATTSSFTVSGLVPAGTTATVTSGGAVFLATTPNNNNPAIGQMAVLGLCPSAGSSTNFGALSFVNMNEVSTVAAAYALGGFMSDSATSLHSVNGTYLSIPSEANPFTTNTISSITAPTVAKAAASPAWIGLANATLNAAQLYNIQGTGPVSSVLNGEGHIANAKTCTDPNPLFLTCGTVSQALINAIANSLAACVDSGHTATSTGSDNCTKLLGWALPTSSGAGGNAVGSGSPTMSGTAPQETATAAINFAHNPWNPDVANIISLPNQASPYLPTVSSAQDLAVTITYPMTGAQSGADGGIAIDQLGNAWVTALNTGAVTELSPTGTILYQDNLVVLPGMAAIDSTGAAWVALRDATLLGTLGTSLEGAYKYTRSGTGAITKNGPYGSTFTGSLTNTSGLYDNIWVSIDKNDNAYFTNHEFNNTLMLTSTGALKYSFEVGANPGTGQSNTTSSTYDGPFANAIDANGSLWMTTNQSQYNNVTLFTNTSATQTTSTKLFGSQLSGSNISPGGTVNDPEGIAIDSVGNAWVASNGANNGVTSATNILGVTVYTSKYNNTTSMYEIGPSGGNIGSTGQSITSYDGGNYGLKNSTGVAIDGSGMLFFSCPGTVHNGGTTNGTPTNGTLSVFNSNTLNFVTGSNGITGTYVSSGTVQPMLNPYFLAVDNAGNLWVNTNTTVVEYMGMATPVLTPISANLFGTGGLARKPQ
jgi:hypothetical protein